MTTSRRNKASRQRAIARISGPAELLQAVPYFLGFHPDQSLVLVGLHDDVLVVTARIDLDDAGVPGAVAHTVAAMARGGSTSVVALVYDAEPPTAGAWPPWEGFAELVADEIVQAGCLVLEVLLVRGSRYWSLSCVDPECCPSEGRPLPDAPSAFAAAATYDGVVALPDRATLAALLEPLPDDERLALAPAVAAAERARNALSLDGEAERWRRSVKRALFAAARACDEPGWTPPADAAVARFGAALRTTTVRDALWMAVDDGRLDGRPLWRELARRLPVPHDVAPIFLFGWASWRAGEGALANIAADRALAGDPDYTAADLLLGALSAGVDPRQLPRLRQRPA